MIDITAKITVPDTECLVSPSTTCLWLRSIKFYKEPKFEGDDDYRYEYSCAIFHQQIPDGKTPCEKCKEARLKNKLENRKTTDANRCPVHDIELGYEGLCRKCGEESFYKSQHPTGKDDNK